MSRFEVHYSHAAPAIRDALLHAVRNANDARTQRDRKAGFAAAYAYGRALDIMSRAGDQEPVDGVMHGDSFNKRDHADLLAFLGGDVVQYERIMGSPYEAP